MSPKSGIEESKKTVAQLKKYKTHTPEAPRAIARLKECRPHARCLSPACKKCSRAWQRACVVATAKIILDFDRRLGRRVAWVALSIVPTGLSTTDPRVVRKVVCEMLRNAGVTLFIGGIDFSVNEDRRTHVKAADRFKAHLSTHVWGFAPAYLVTTEAKKALRAANPKSNSVERPIWSKRFNRKTAGIAYAWKPKFFRRVSETVICMTRTGVPRRTSKPRTMPLRVRQEVRLHGRLNIISFEDRLVLVGVKPIGLDGALRFEVEP
jgi:hypothetical protein